MKEAFQDEENVSEINKKLAENGGQISDKEISVSLDATARGNWEAGIITNLDGIPFVLVGKGEQSCVKIQMALGDAADKEVLLIEEPENHLSYTRLHALLTKITEKAQGRQTFLTTHSSLVLNKLDVGQVMLFNGERGLRLTDLTPETRDYFKKLPGHDTLRMILGRKVILVEGPSDELIVQKAIQQQYNQSHLSLGVDVISVRSLAFKRFLEIAVALKIPTRVVTDNDGDVAAVTQKYEALADHEFVDICFDDNEAFPSLEDQLVRANERNDINNILGTEHASDAELIAYMKRNKTECALRILKSENEITVPEYISYAIRELDS